MMQPAITGLVVFVITSLFQTICMRVYREELKQRFNKVKVWFKSDGANGPEFELAPLSKGGDRSILPEELTSIIQNYLDIISCFVSLLAMLVIFAEDFNLNSTFTALFYVLLTAFVALLPFFLWNPTNRLHDFLNAKYLILVRNFTALVLLAYALLILALRLLN